MAAKKISGLNTLTTLASEDLMMLVDDPTGSPENKKMSVGSFLSQLSANTHIKENLIVDKNVNLLSNTNVKVLNVSSVVNSNAVSVANNNIVVQNSFTPANGTIPGYAIGSISWDDNFLYVRTSTRFRKVPLQDL